MKVKFTAGSKKGQVAEVGGAARALIALGRAEAVSDEKPAKKKSAKKKGTSKRKDIRPED